MGNCNGRINELSLLAACVNVVPDPIPFATGRTASTSWPGKATVTVSVGEALAPLAVSVGQTLIIWISSSRPTSSSQGRERDDLREYNVPVLASQVLEAESVAAASSSSSYFICDSDSLQYGDFIPVIESEEPLHAEQIYFVLLISCDLVVLG